MSEQPKTKLFREKSLEAVESPESLNDYLRVTSPGIWLVMASVIVLLIGGILWGIFGHIRTTADFAVAVTKEKSVCYVTYDGLRDLKTGMQVQVTPANRQRERWGYACGTVVGIEEYPTNRQEIVNRVKLDPLASFIEDGQAVYEVRVTLDEQDGKLVWSREKSKDVKIGNGSLCDIQIITHKKPVWRVLIGAVENATETVMGN